MVISVTGLLPNVLMPFVVAELPTVVDEAMVTGALVVIRGIDVVTVVPV